MAQSGYSSDFWERQSQARKRSMWFIGLFLAAVFVTASFLHVLARVFIYMTVPEVQASGFPLEYDIILQLTFMAFMLAVSFHNLRLIRREGGFYIAQLLKCRYLAGDDPDLTLKEIAFLNVVEEMCIASGLPMPEVYVAPEEGINALVAGLRPDDTVLVVTEGAIKHLNRGELSGVVGHELGHIRHGDLSVNIYMVGWLKGLLVLSIIGQFLMRIRPSSRSNGKGAMALILMGLMLALLGWIGKILAGLIQAGFSREREKMADAAAVEFNRDPEGLASALKKIGGFSSHGYISSSEALSVRHFFIATPVKSIMSLWDSHPPLEERIRILDPNWNGRFINPVTSEAYEPFFDKVAEEKKNLARSAASAASPTPGPDSGGNGIQNSPAWQEALKKAHSEAGPRLSRHSAPTWSDVLNKPKSGANLSGGWQLLMGIFGLGARASSPWRPNLNPPQPGDGAPAAAPLWNGAPSQTPGSLSPYNFGVSSPKGPLDFNAPLTAVDLMIQRFANNNGLTELAADQAPDWPQELKTNLADMEARVRDLMPADVAKLVADPVNVHLALCAALWRHDQTLGLPGLTKAEQVLSELLGSQTVDHIQILAQSLEVLEGLPLLPIADAALPAILAMDEEKRKRLVCVLSGQIRASGRMDMFKVALGYLLRPHLGLLWLGAVPEHTSPTGALTPVMYEAIEIIFSVMARQGHPDSELDALKAYESGLANLRLTIGACGLKDKSLLTARHLSKALLDVSQAPDFVKKRIFMGLARTVMHDQHITVTEYDFLRVFKAALCPGDAGMASTAN